MGGVVSAVVDTVSSVVDTVGSVAADAVNTAANVVDSVVQPVAKAVESTVDSALKDPIGTVAKVAAIASGNPQFIPLISGADAMARGASLEQALTSAGTSYIAGEFTPDVGGDVTNFTGSDILGQTAQGATAGAISSGLRGGDVLQGATAGALNTGLNTAIDQGASSVNYQLNQPNGGLPDVKLPGDVTAPGEDFNFDQIKANADAANTPVDYSVSGTPASGGLDANATGAGLTMDSIQGRSPSLTKMGGGQGVTVPVDGGALGAAGYTDAGAMPALGDPSSFINNPNVTGQPVVPSPACAYDVNVPNINFASLLAKSPTTGNRQKALGYAFNLEDAGVPWLDTRAQMLKGIDNIEEPVPDITGHEEDKKSGVPALNTPSASPKIAGITPEMASVLAERGINLAHGGSVPHFACGSSATYCSTWGPMGQYAPKFYPVKCNMLTSAGGKRTPMTLAPLKQMQTHIAPGGNIGGMAKGGLPAKYEEAKPDGHEPEFITGLTGYYACGGGTGQSDDIDAMLHDGDYVIDAEAVSALGDGSSKAGKDVLMHFMHQIPHQKDGGGKPVPAKIADGEVVLPASFVTALGGGDNKHGAKMLDEMRKRLREHKRSAPETKIPPKAKSPLEYLKGAKG
jgi:hypothetical protein